MKTVTDEWLNSFKTDLGAWTMLQFKAIGIAWPPRHGWKQQVIGSTITDQAAELFERSRTHAAKAPRPAQDAAQHAQNVYATALSVTVT